MTKKITKLMLNGEEYEIREYQAWRQPWPNTVLYFPLTSDAVDTIAWVSLSNWWWTVSYVNPSWLNISCAYFSSAWYLYKNTATSQLPTWASVRTISGWAYFESGSRSWIANYWSWANNQMCSLNVYESGISYGWRFTQRGSWSTRWSTQPLNTWTNVVLTYDWSNIVWYLNWVQDNSWTYTINTSNSNLYLWVDMSSNMGGVSWWLQGYLSQVIIEDKCWTAQEVEDYYNLTKWDYWIS